MVAHELEAITHRVLGERTKPGYVPDARLWEG